jgi:hypothetical protein
MWDHSRVYSMMEYNAIISHGQSLIAILVSNNYLSLDLIEKKSDINKSLILLNANKHNFRKAGK